MKQYAGLPDAMFQRASGNYSILFESARCDAENYRSYLFTDPVAVLRAHTLEDLHGVFDRIREYRADNHYIAGYLGYECGYYFKNMRAPKANPGHPPAWFGVYRAPVIFNHRDDIFEGTALDPSSVFPGSLSDEFSLQDAAFDIGEGEYHDKIARIKEYIARGDVYQINFSGKFRFRFHGSALGLYRMLKMRQSVSYSSLLNVDGLSILSFSPELFFRLHGGKITTKPMKGTAPRGLTEEEDRVLKKNLETSDKNRAENVMIVDVLRNDLGKIAKTGSVSVPALFHVETYETLFQMISTVEGRLENDIEDHALFNAVFPGGSITGAPKRRAMEIINELESGARGIYTGAIGFLAPDKTGVFNIAIRTIAIRDGQGEMGAGGGIVWDSDPAAEYRECLLKGEFLTTAPGTFELLETLLWDGTFLFLEEHIERLAGSALHFSYPFDQETFRGKLQEKSRVFEKGGKYRVRITHNAWGKTSIQSSLIGPSGDSPVRILLSSLRTDSRDSFLYHKTTKRAMYDACHADAVRRGFADVIFLNEKDEVTEGAISNIFVRKGDALLTPVVRCGLLNGVYRQHVLKTDARAKEAVLHLSDLEAADELFICNSVRGLRKACLVKA